MYSVLRELKKECATMSAIILLCLMLVSHSSPERVIMDSMYKLKNIIPIPVGMVPRVADSVAKGADMALTHCQNLFQWDKWNCPTSSFLRLPNKRRPTRETAFSKAILAAGLVHRITKDCSRGDISKCGCDTNLGPPSSSLILNKTSLPYTLSREQEDYSTEWSWGGCSDSPRFALEVTKKMLNSLENGNDARAYIGRHNNNVGRQIVRDTMVKKCRCHGVSGSCSMQVCWMQVAPFKELAKRLREKYKRAERVSYEALENSVTLGNSARELVNEKVIPVQRRSLVYLDQSPDYCISNSSVGSFGTRGRKCSRNSSDSASLDEMRSCRTLCRDCGYRVRKLQKKESMMCNCKFHWCCEVKCETCVVDIDEYFCY